ncbi:hypothetical protein [Candidatus Marinarcus aquaticus]|uniref:Uncharacterized protein n=1 Tax=Candidatus Marinarcus aquaticus TaxID=2044504 RepID=A0A4Q0XSA1_9BACT|nr:hypothetical protein [Candidatus Marinarcus aquaticus]RXJ58185.1 hypothetical protein CRV04_06665 [Candidatus Marinarcus aquaticus]
MSESTGFPLELISNLLSIIIVAGIIYKFYQYKKKMNVLSQLTQLKEDNKLTEEDNAFITTNLLEYEIQLEKDKSLIKLAYPFFILIAGVLMLTFSMAEALIHINIVIVTFIYLYISKIHTQNFIQLLKNLKA